MKAESDDLYIAYLHGKSKANETIRKQTQKIAELTTVIATKELENLRLLDALKASLWFVPDHPMQPENKRRLGAITDAISAGVSIQALPALVEKVEKLTIERCTVFLTDKSMPKSKDARFRSGLNIAAGEIRALPTGGIKLEDLL